MSTNSLFPGITYLIPLSTGINDLEYMRGKRLKENDNEPQSLRLREV